MYTIEGMIHLSLAHNTLVMIHLWHPTHSSHSSLTQPYMGSSSGPTWAALLALHGQLFWPYMGSSSGPTWAVLRHALSGHSDISLVLITNKIIFLRVT